MYELLICTTSGTVLKRFDLAPAEEAGRRVMIGRAADCDVRISCASVSRHHCVVERDDAGDWIVRDLGSTHGIEVEGTRLPQTHLRDGLTVAMGPAVLKFQASRAAIAEELAREADRARS